MRKKEQQKPIEYHYPEFQATFRIRFLTHVGKFWYKIKTNRNFLYFFINFNFFIFEIWNEYCQFEENHSRNNDDVNSTWIKITKYAK